MLVDISQLVKISVAARKAGVGRQSIYQLVASGRFKVTKISGVSFVDMRQVQLYIRERTNRRRIRKLRKQLMSRKPEIRQEDYEVID